MSGDVDHIFSFGGSLFADHVLDGVDTLKVRRGEQDAGWYPVWSSSTTVEEVEVSTAFAFNAGQTFGCLIDFEPPAISVCRGVKDEVGVGFELSIMVCVAGGLGGESGYVKVAIAAGFREGDVDVADRQCVSEEGSARGAPVLPCGGLLMLVVTG